MSEVSLRALNPCFRQGFVLVRFSRRWKYRGGRDDGELRHIDLVLLDSEVGPDALIHQGPLLVEGKMYKMRRFRVIPARNSYKPVDSQYMIDIAVRTLIEEVVHVPQDFPCYTYRLTAFSKLGALAGDTKAFVDVIGVITEIGALDTVHLQNQAAAMIPRAITLRDTDNYEMKLLLWGRRASEFDAEEIQNLSQEKPVVLIVVGLLVKSFRGDISLSGNSAARWYVNADVPEVHSFMVTMHYESQPILPPAEDNLPPELQVQGRYKICLFATDGTAEAEFVFFGNVGCRLVGKEIRTLMRTCPRADAVPSEIATLVSQKQAIIPQIVVHPPPNQRAATRVETSSGKNKNPVEQGATSSAVSPPRNDDTDAPPPAIIDTPDKTSIQCQDTHMTMTPSSLTSTEQPPVLMEEIPKATKSTDTTVPKVRRRLLMESFADDEVQLLDDDETVSLAGDVDDSEEDVAPIPSMNFDRRYYS
ncbi:hypothetical protein QOZ80_7BG0596750 [Eleusine coracana subsp. coracana]|nr:hypothetical protein QOZ80_7BG0596750 [Eleusine coracana subsp. coracana]